MIKTDRLKKFQQTLAKSEMAGALLSYSRDIYYYTGTTQPGYLAVLPDDYLLFLRNGLSFARREVFIDPAKVLEEPRLERIAEWGLPQLKTRCLGTETDFLSANQVDKIRRAFGGLTIVDVSPRILEQRQGKDPEELECIREACRAIDEGHRAVMAGLRAGMTELELAAAVERAHRLAGHEGTFFFRQPGFFMGTGPLASGPNLLQLSGVLLSLTGAGLSPAMPIGPSRRIIQRGDTVLVDIPTLVRGYHADQTRTYTVGKAPETARRMFAALKTISDHLIERIRPGMEAAEIYRMAVEKSVALGVADLFLNLGQGRKTHLVGHGCGLECNEPPFLSARDRSRLPEDVVVTIELHLLDDVQGAVKLEDMIRVGRQGNEILN
ncbi:MAG: aminopeptidase P family protein, partial [Deltaproteobacteria bacterium]|nr:aminopeptidase P family protein [Deltaproteobacteria bacterium]